MIKKSVKRLSIRQIQALGTVVGGLLYILLSARRQIARQNLKFSHLTRSIHPSRNFMHKVFHHFGTTLVEMVQMSVLTREECLGRIWVQGEEYLTKALMEGKGVIFISAHIGNWESALQFYPLYFQKPVLAVVKPFKNFFVNQWMHTFRSRFGNQLIYTKGALGEMIQTLRRGGAIGIMIDMNRQKQGIPVKFLRHDVTVTPAAAMLALRCKSPVIPILCHRDPEGRQIFKIEPPIPMRRSGDLRSDLQFNTQLMTDVVEKAVCRHPDQWYWMQKRWKTFYPELYPEYFSARQKRKQKKLSPRGVR